MDRAYASASRRSALDVEAKSLKLELDARTVVTSSFGPNGARRPMARQTATVGAEGIAPLKAASQRLRCPSGWPEARWC